MNTITFNNKEFPIREIKLPEFGYVTLSTSSLSAQLLNDKYEPISGEAERIDEKIFLFVEEDEFVLSDKDLKALLISYDL